MESESQQSPDQYFEIDPPANQETIDKFIAELDGAFEYPAFSHMGEVVDDPTPTPDDELPEDDDEEAPEVDETPVPDTVTVAGKQVPLAELEELYRFSQSLKETPSAAPVAPVSVVPAAPAIEANEELTPPDFLDMEDPAHKFMWESHVAQQKQLADFQQSQAAREQEAINQRAVADMDVALTRFRTAHPNFNDDQIMALRQHGAAMNIIPAVMATTPNPVDALVRVLDIAALDHTDLRTVYLDDTVGKTPTTKQRSTERKQKLNALGGSSGSAPRTTPATRPMSDREAIDQFAAGLAESFGQN